VWFLTVFALTVVQEQPLLIESLCRFPSLVISDRRNNKYHSFFYTQLKNKYLKLLESKCVISSFLFFLCQLNRMFKSDQQVMMMKRLSSNQQLVTRHRSTLTDKYEEKFLGGQNHGFRTSGD
jgi:hypothetical protein